MTLTDKEIDDLLQSSKIWTEFRVPQTHWERCETDHHCCMIAKLVAAIHSLRNDYENSMNHQNKTIRNLKQDAEIALGIAARDLAAARHELITLRGACDIHETRADQLAEERDTARAEAEALRGVIVHAAKVMRGDGGLDQGQAYDEGLRTLDAALSAKEQT